MKNTCVAGRCVRSFGVQLVNRSCATLTWSLSASCPTAHSMVVQWSSRRHRGSGRDSWARLPHSHSPAYLTGNPASTLHLLRSPVPALKAVVSPPQGTSLTPTTTSTFTRCLRTARGSRRSPQVGTGTMLLSSSRLACISFLIQVAFIAAAKRGEAAVHQMLLIVSFLAAALFVTLIISQQK